jgi:predicted GIY-YIG superfamily endonuclease
MTDYSKTVIYKIQHLDKDELLYVGHTSNFIKRKNNHKSSCKTHSLPLYKMMRENGGWDCFTMIVLKDFPCDSKTEACIEEDKVMREMKASMNTLRAYLSPEERVVYHKEYQQANKEHISESKKKYRQANIERISEQKREPIECECGCTIKRGDLAKHRKTTKHLNLTT